jgi:hypothetical protein
MTIQEAYKKAIEYPIKDLPNIKIVCGKSILYLQESIERSSIELRDVDTEDDLSPYLTIMHADLMSKNWSVEIGW